MTQCAALLFGPLMVMASVTTRITFRNGTRPRTLVAVARRCSSAAVVPKFTGMPVEFIVVSVASFTLLSTLFLMMRLPKELDAIEREAGAGQIVNMVAQAQRSRAPVQKLECEIAGVSGTLFGGFLADWLRRRWETGRVITVHEAQLNLGLGAELAARITEQCFYSLEAPVLRVAGFDIPYPPSRVEDEYLPDLDRVLDMVDRSLAY